MTWTPPSKKRRTKGNIRNRLKAALIPTNDGTQRSNLGQHGVIGSENKVISGGIFVSAQIIPAIEAHSKRGGLTLKLKLMAQMLPILLNNMSISFCHSV